MLIEIAERLREQFTAEGNRFGMMAREAEGLALFTFGKEHQKAKAEAAKWQLAQHLSYVAAGNVAHAFGIPEYGAAWHERLHPHELRDREAAKAAGGKADG